MNVFELTKQYAWLIGNAYAFQLRNGQPWVRVLFETYCDGRRKVFFVNLGLLFHLKPNMIFHELSDRFVLIFLITCICIYVYLFLKI